MALCAATLSDRGGGEGGDGWGPALARSSHIHLILMCLQED